MFLLSLLIWHFPPNFFRPNPEDTHYFSLTVTAVRPNLILYHVAGSGTLRGAWMGKIPDFLRHWRGHLPLLLDLYIIHFKI